MLNDLVATVAGMAEQYNNRPIVIEAVPSAISVRADCNCLKQVLLNLIDNAVKFSDPSEPVNTKPASLNVSIGWMKSAPVLPAATV